MGFLSKTLGRSHKDEKRIEDSIPFDTYIKKIEWIDLGHKNFLFAKYDFPLDYTRTDENLLSIEEILEIEKRLPSNIHIITKSNLEWLKHNCKIVKYNPENWDNFLTHSICCISDRTDEMIHFNVSMTIGSQEQQYYIKESKTTPHYVAIEETRVGPHKFPSYLGTVKISYVYNSNMNENKYSIKLIKLK